MDLQYPIGRFEKPEKVEMAQIESWIKEFAGVAKALSKAVEGLDATQLDTPYRPGGWTVRQVVHHLADSHMNAYINFRLGLLEDNLTTRSANVDALAGLIDARTADVQLSLNLLAALHERWVILLKSMDTQDFERTVETSGRGVRTLATLLGTYSWHSRHHIAHITSLRERMGW